MIIIAYVKQNFRNGNVLYAEQLNTMEDEIAQHVGDVQINGETIVEDGVATIPNATNEAHGVVKIGAGLGVDNSGYLYLKSASNSDIDNKSNTNAITPFNYEYAVKRALINEDGEAWTDEEKASVRNTIGTIIASYDDFVSYIKENE